MNRWRAATFRGLAVIGMMSAITTTLVGCGGSGLDGGWVEGGPDSAYFLQISNGTGTVDYASQSSATGGQPARFYGDLVVHDDGTIAIEGMVDGELKDCSACLYQLTNGNLVINYTFISYATGQPVSGTMTLSPGDVSQYNKDIQSFQPIEGYP